MDLEFKSKAELMAEDTLESIEELRRRLDAEYGHLTKEELAECYKKVGDFLNTDEDDKTIWAAIYYLTKYHGDEWRL